MPNRVDDFAPYRLLLYIRSRLDQISTANGYNCDPHVYTDLQAAKASNDKHVLFVDVEAIADSPPGIGQNPGPRTNPRVVLVVVGKVKYETDNPRKLALALEQDVRTAIQSDTGGLRDVVGRGGVVSFGGSAHDGGTLAPMKEAGFRLAVEVTFSQGGTW